MKGAYVFFADGFEETEALAPIDVLRRGGIDLKIVSIYNDRKLVNGSHNIPIQADMTYAEFLSTASEGACKDDLMLFPGGLPGSSNLAAHSDLMGKMCAHYADGGTVAAICAAPSLVLSQLSGLEGLQMTCYDGFEGNLVAAGAVYVKDGVTVDGNVICGRGAGHAITFGLAILSHLKGPAAADAIARAIML